MLWLVLWASSSSAQVYNFTPFSHYDRETSPSIFAARSQDNLFSATHRQNLLNEGNYYQSNFTYSKYLPGAFSGVGITLNTTKLNDSVSYNYAGIGGAYRTVVFNKVYLKVGAMYKYIDVNAPSGLMDHYDFIPQDSFAAAGSVQNVNLGFSLSSPGDNYHLSFSMLNRPVPWAEKQDFEPFPRYFVLNAGDFYTLFTQRKNVSIKTVAFYQTNSSYGNSPWSFYLDGYATVAKLSRKSTLFIGGRYGYAEDRFFHFTPNISYYRSSYSSMTIRFSYDMGFHNKTWNTTFKPVAQLSLIIQPTSL